MGSYRGRGVVVPVAMFEDSITEQPVGFIGIGRMGFPMAQNVLESGFETHVLDVQEDVLAEFEDLGGHRAASARELARECRSVHMVVRDDEQINAIVRGDDGVFAGFTETDGGVLVIHSTVGPETPEGLAADAPEGVSVIDAAISGAPFRAREGTLSLMVGGDDDPVEYLWPVFDTMARRIFHVGSIGSGMATKLANNLVTLSNQMILAEGLRLGTEYGIDEDTLLDVFEASAANSFVVENWKFFCDPDSHDGGLEGYSDLCAKDFKHITDLARELELSLEGTGVAAQKVPHFWRNYLDE